jgi:DNA-binding response OmpR family regulator
VSPAAHDRSLSQGRRIVICDYNALLLSVTGLLRMSGYCVFQAYDAQAARELCLQLPNIGLLVLNTTGTGTDTPTLVRDIRENHPSLPVLHIGTSTLDGMPANVPTLAESFTAGQLLLAVEALLSPSELSESLPSEEAHSFQADLDGLLRERAAIRRRSERPGRQCQATMETVRPS